MRWRRNILASWASRRYRGRHRHGLSVAVIAARLADFAGDDCVTQIIPTPNAVRHVERVLHSEPARGGWVRPTPAFDLPTIEIATVRAAHHAGLLAA